MLPEQKTSLWVFFENNYLYLVVFPQGVRGYLIVFVRPP